MNDKEIFDTLNNYAKNYVLIHGSNLIKYDKRRGGYYFDMMIDEINTTAFTSYHIDDDLLSEALTNINIEVDGEGFYSFEALLYITQSENNWSLEYSINHIEYKFECSLEEHYRRVDDFYSFMNKNDGEVPF